MASELKPCPYPCGWTSLHSLIVKRASYFACATIDDDFPESIREAGIRLGQYALDLCKQGMTEPQPDTAKPITKRQLDAIWEHGFDAESSDEQEYCDSLIRARDSVDGIAKPDTVAVERSVLRGLVEFCEQPEIVAATDGAFDPDAYVRIARALLDQEK